MTLGSPWGAFVFIIAFSVVALVALVTLSHLWGWCRIKHEKRMPEQWTEDVLKSLRSKASPQYHSYRIDSFEGYEVTVTALSDKRDPVTDLPVRRDV